MSAMWFRWRVVGTWGLFRGFLINLERNENSKKILQLKSLFKIRLEADTYRPPRKATQCWNCQGFLRISTQCFMDPKCVSCGDVHKSPDCPRKIAEISENEEKIKKPPQSGCNCGSQHPASCKACKNFPLKSRFRKSYADIAKNKKDKPKKDENQIKPPKKEISQAEQKMVPPDPV